MGRPSLTFTEVFTDRIYPEPNTGCWIWGGPIGPDGYGSSVLIINGVKTTRAHRISYMISKGSIPNGMLICHSCDNRWCVNPDHLFVGTPKDNSQDMVKKGRRPKGPRNKKLNKDQVLLIRNRIKNGEKLLGIANEFGVCLQNISSIKRGLSWK